MQRLAGEHLQLRIERGADREAALVKLLAPVHVDQVAPHLLGEEFGGEEVVAARARGYDERAVLRSLPVGGADVAVLDHAVDHPVPALDRAILMAEGIIVLRRFRQRREIGRLADGQLVDGLVEVVERRGRHAVGAEAEINLVQVELEDLVLRVGLLDPEREQRLLDLALVGDLPCEEEVLRHLLGDGGCADRSFARAAIAEVDDGGAQYAGDVEAVVLVEVLVFRREERSLDQIGDGLDREIEAPLARMLRHQLAVGRVDACHHRRLVLGQTVVVGQVGVERLQENARGHSETEKHEGSYPEDVA